jgi:hypothetical protein
LSVDKNDRQRGSDAPDAPLLVEGDGFRGEVDVVIGGKECDEPNHKAALGLDPALAIEAEERPLEIFQFWPRLTRSVCLVTRSRLKAPLGTFGWNHAWSPLDNFLA